jgi:predicted MFS family arabinose efflux permease
MIVLDYSFVRKFRTRSNGGMDGRFESAATWRVCVAGALGLAVAMGIGRFAATPLLPLMQREGQLDADGAAWLAAVNYAGYLAGALSAARLAARPRRLVLACLLATPGVTAVAGLTHSLAAWLLLRAAAGLLSAWVLVGISHWSVGELARRRRADASGWVFSGVGVGIAAAGSLAWAAGGAGPSALWLALGGLALIVSLSVWRLWPVPAHEPRVGPSAATSTRTPRGSAGLVVCYGIFGFGYILPATYLPSLARNLVDDPRLFGLVWPMFGLAAAASTLLAGHALRHFRLLDIWAGCHLLMAAGCVLPLVSRSGPAIGLSALLVGGTFMVATMMGLQQARLLCVGNAAPLLARMTAAFALGQIAGPLAALLLARLPVHAWSGIELTLAIAAALLGATAVWLHLSSTVRETTHERSAHRASH